MRPEVEFSTSVRLLLMAFYIVPSFFNIKLFPAVFIIFCSISRNSFSPILPTTPFFILLVILIAYFLYQDKSRFPVKAIAVFLYYLLVSTFYFDFSQDFLIWVPVAILVADMIKNKQDLQLLFVSFIIITFFLSFLYVFNQDAFIRYYGGVQSEGIETSGWVNSNAFGAIIAAGGVFSVGYLTGILKFERNLYTTILCVITLAVSFYVLVLNASRSSFFSFAIVSVLMLFLSKSKIYIKVLLVIGLLFFIVWMLNNNVFELLIFRMQEDTFNTGGDRTRIWQVKISQFFMENNSLKLLFGIGRENCDKLGEFISTHNDFVTSLVGFGLVGFILFVYFILIYPLRLISLASKNNFLSVGLLMVYFIIECCMMEPFFRGNITIIMTYFFIIKYAMLIKHDDSLLKS